MRRRRPDLPIPETLDQAVMKCLKKRINERPKGAAQLEQMLSMVPLEGLAMSYPPGISRRAPAQGSTLSREEARRAPRD
jgi:serine/threonine-protein kinase